MRRTRAKSTLLQLAQDHERSYVPHRFLVRANAADGMHVRLQRAHNPDRGAVAAAGVRANAGTIAVPRGRCP